MAVLLSALEDFEMIINMTRELNTEIYRQARQRII